MFGLIDCTHYYDTLHGPKIILDRANFTVDYTDRVGLLAPEGSGKSTIIRLLAGVQAPREGMVLGKRGDTSILGNAASLNAEMTGEENIRNFAEMGHLPADELGLFCQQFADIGDDFYHPVKAYSGGTRARLAFALSLALPVRIYLADDKISVGEPAFRTKCEAALDEALEDRGLVFITRNPRLTERVCDIHGVVSHGRIIICDSHDEARRLFERVEDDEQAEPELVPDEIDDFYLP